MKTVKYNHLSKDEIENFTDILYDSFRKNDFIYKYLMGSTDEVLKRFMKMTIKFNNGFADYYALVKDDGTLCAAAIYLPEGCEPLGIVSALKRNKILLLLKSFLFQPIKYTKRMISFSQLEESYWIKEPFVMLDMVVSREKGCGKRLIEETLLNYEGKNIILNSSVGNSEHTYYTQFGFEVYEKLVMDDYRTAMMIKKSQST